MKKICFIILIYILICGQSTLKSRNKVEYEIEKTAMYSCEIKYKFENYRIIKTYACENNDFKAGAQSMRLRIMKEDKIVYEMNSADGNDHYFLNGSCIELKPPKGCLPLIGEDINGNGEPDLVIGNWTGGAHCCAEYYFFEMGKEFKYVETLNSADSAFVFKDVDDDGSLELIGKDWQLAYLTFGWSLCGPAPAIILKFINGKYILAMDLMKKETYLSDWIRIGNYGSCSNNYIIKGYAVELIYEGNAEKAWRFLFGNLKDERERGSAVDEFKKNILSKSPYWESIKTYYKW